MIENRNDNCDGKADQSLLDEAIKAAQQRRETAYQQKKAREAYALNNGATTQAARDFAVQSDQPPTLPEYCDFLISHLS